MTIKNFRIIEAKQSPPSALTDTERAKQDLIENLRDRPLWEFNIEVHKVLDRQTSGDCCFNHIIGLPTKN